MEYDHIKICGNKLIMKTLRNGMIVEFISGHLAENIRFHHIDGKTISYKETSDTKWGAIGIIENTHDGVPESKLIKYRIRIVWNNEKLANYIVGANLDNIKRLDFELEKKWVEFINKKIDEYNDKIKKGGK